MAGPRTHCRLPAAAMGLAKALGRVCAGLLLAGAAGGAARAEQPWAEQGDKQLRQDVETLKGYRLIKGPVDSWPLPWSQIIEGVEAAEAGHVPPFVAAAAARLRANAGVAEQDTSYEVRAGGTNRPALIRDFGYTAREKADVAIRVTNNLGNLTINYGVGYRYHQAGDDYHFEPSSFVFRAGNWALYGGYVGKYYGPGNDSALMFSNGARPFPKIGIQRLYPYKPRPKLLRWIGPWRFDFFGGVLDERRLDVKFPIEFGMRFSFEPARGLEIGLNRSILICGGRVPTTVIQPGDPTGGTLCGVSPVTKALFPFFGGTQPGDSLAGIDLAFTRPIGGAVAKVYYEAEGEDKNGIQQFDQVGQIGGATLTLPVGGKGASAQVLVEYIDTLARIFTTDRAIPGSFYGNTFFFSGKEYKGNPLGASIGGDGDMTTIGVSVTDTLNRRYYSSYRHANINKTGRGFIAPSANPETINIGTLGTEWPTGFGDVRVEGRVMDNDVNTPGRSPTKGEFEVSWRTRF